jgi:hypothetical protein
MTVPQHCGSGHPICCHCSLGCGGYCSCCRLSSSPGATVIVIVVLVAALQSASSASLQLSSWQSFTRGCHCCSHNCHNCSWPLSLLHHCPSCHRCYIVAPAIIVVMSLPQLSSCGARHHRCCGRLASTLVDVVKGGVVCRHFGVAMVGFACHRLRGGLG